ncbi:hypothetical protein EIB18_18200 [Caulobacter vibrioides]|nr:hypothetical protein CA608_18105 [Caulobacter vibrioides]AZH14443.1 hypothetical protein EIB18_18200 [Caulobacter vibrioides]PLR10831.1 hypothetical protein CVUC_12170 [Caulobacter vibrioides]
MGEDRQSGFGTLCRRFTPAPASVAENDDFSGARVAAPRLGSRLATSR